MTLIADMERMGMVRRLRLERFTQLETAEFAQQVLGGKVNVSSAATMHAQAEGVAFIVEELARTCREMGMIQEVSGTWTLARTPRACSRRRCTLIQRRAARLPDETKRRTSLTPPSSAAASASGSPLDQGAAGGGRGRCSPTVLAESLAPAARAGLLLEHAAGSPADYSFTHDQVTEFSAALLGADRRRAIHGARRHADRRRRPARREHVLLAHHALAAGDEDAPCVSSLGRAGGLDARAAEEVLRIVDQGLPAASAAQDRLALLTFRDEALGMLRRSRRPSRRPRAAGGAGGGSG